MFTAGKVAAPKIERISLRAWEQGTVTAYDDGRTPTDGLRGSGNVVLDQDGTLRPRPSLILYGEQPTGTILGEIFEFVYATSTGSENYEIAMMDMSGTARPYIRKDGGSWSATTGKTYDTTARTHYLQADDKVLVMNGQDNLSYFDIPTVVSTKTIVPFTALSTPSAPTTAKTGLTGTTYTYYYRITANSTVGETAASVAASVQVGAVRETWDNTTNYVTVSWSAVAGATSYNLYLGSVSGQEFLIVAGINGLSYKDIGAASAPPDVTRQAPLTDSTAGPKAAAGSVINGRVFLYREKDNPRTIYAGGTGTSVLNFSPFGGGGTIEIGKGTKEFPVKVMPYRDGRGTPQITILCRGTNGKGKRYTMAPATLTVGDTIIDYFEVVEDNGQDGTDSPDGVILYNDSLWYPSRDGFKTTGTKPQLQNILSTNRVSNTIQTDIKNLNTAAMEMCVGLGFEGKLHWALPVGSETNNEIWTLDLDRKGAWMKPWTVSADWMWLYNDNNGVTHFCILSGNQIYEFSYAQATNDNGMAFPTSASSGLIKFSDDGMEWAKVIDVTFFLQRPQGSINLLVAGKTEDASLATTGSRTFTSSSSVAGWSESGWGSWGWSNPPLVPTQYGDANKAVVIEVDEELEWLTWELNSTGAGVNYQLSDVVVRFVRIGTKELE
jgi:hypothetical protein